MIRYLEKIRGATRVSVGIASSEVDLDRFMRFPSGLLNKKARQLAAAA
jgi:hypothetical protein